MLDFDMISWMIYDMIKYFVELCNVWWRTTSDVEWTSPVCYGFFPFGFSILKCVLFDEKCFRKDLFYYENLMFWYVWIDFVLYFCYWEIYDLRGLIWWLFVLVRFGVWYLIDCWFVSFELWFYVIVNLNVLF